MKKLFLLFFFICIHSSMLMSFTGNPLRKKVWYQGSFWPQIKGRWWPSRDESGDLIQMQNIFPAKGFINFFSRDSCEMETRRYDDVFIREKYRWINNIDTLIIYRKSDTLVAKIIKLSSSDFQFRPL